jgi:hypothetical protein
MLVLGRDLQAVQKVINGIASLWEIKDLGDMALILGIRVRRDRTKRTLFLNQSEYIAGLMERFRLGEAKPINLPVNNRNTLIAGQSGEEQANQSLYQEAIGYAIWVSKGSRPNITYVVGQLSQYYSEPTIRYWNAILRVFRYLKGTIDYSISYGIGKAKSPKLQGFSNTDFAGNIVDRRSTIGHLYLLNKGPVTWSSIK